jgi:hypothetical protein
MGSATGKNQAGTVKFLPGLKFTGSLFGFRAQVHLRRWSIVQSEGFR